MNSKNAKDSAESSNKKYWKKTKFVKIHWKTIVNKRFDKMEEAMQDKPQDLSMKSSRKVKPIPPPLDLNARTLDEEATDLRLPKSPGDMPRECLPIRKR